MKAFPHKVMSAEQGQGMDLRDYFAAKAIPVLLEKILESEVRVTQKQFEKQIKDTVKASFVIADAMMEARKK